jgi:hypothetical protein
MNPILRNSKYENALIPQDSAASIMIMLLADLCYIVPNCYMTVLVKSSENLVNPR